MSKATNTPTTLIDFVDHRQNEVAFQVLPIAVSIFPTFHHENVSANRLMRGATQRQNPQKWETGL
jgi:hypothetical protein